jgi:hypothetical protein
LLTSTGCASMKSGGCISERYDGISSSESSDKASSSKTKIQGAQFAAENGSVPHQLGDQLRLSHRGQHMIDPKILGFHLPAPAYRPYHRALSREELHHISVI